MSPGLFCCCWMTTPPIDEMVVAVMRLLMMFWKIARSKRPPSQFAVAPASIWFAVSGCRFGLPKIVVPIGVTVKLAPSSVAVGARKPLEAPTRRFSQSVAAKVAPTE